MREIELSHADLTFLLTGVCGYRHGFHARGLHLWLWSTHCEYHKTEQVNDHEGMSGVVFAAVLYVYVVVTEC